MNKYIGLAAFFLLLILQGCTSAPTREVVTETKTVLIEVPKPLLTQVKASEPPNRQEYVSMNEKQRESTLTKYSNTLLGQLNTCNDQLRSISMFQEKEKMIIEQGNKK